MSPSYCDALFVGEGGEYVRGEEDEKEEDEKEEEGGGRGNVGQFSL